MGSDSWIRLLTHLDTSTVTVPGYIWRFCRRYPHQGERIGSNQCPRSIHLWIHSHLDASWSQCEMAWKAAGKNGKSTCQMPPCCSNKLWHQSCGGDNHNCLRSRTRFYVPGPQKTRSRIRVTAGEKLLVFLLQGSRELTSTDKPTSENQFCFFAFYVINWVMSGSGEWQVITPASTLHS